jgi:hypothetical protein
MGVLGLNYKDLGLIFVRPNQPFLRLKVVRHRKHRHGVNNQAVAACARLMEC